MKYLITGGAGFIGSHLADALLQRGESVTAIDNLSTSVASNLDSAQNFFPKTFRFVEADIRQNGLLDSLIAPGDVIFHLAATVGVKKVCQDPNETWRNNFQPTETLVEIATRKNCRLVFASTSEVYGDAGGRKALSENDPPSVHTHLAGRSAYILGKMMSEHICLNANQLYDTRVAVARFFNTTGPRQSAVFGMVIPTFIAQALRNEPISVFGDGSQTRSFSDVRDTVEALLQLLDCPEADGEIVNIGNPEEISVLDLAHCIRAMTDSRSKISLLPMPAEREGNKDILFRKPCIQKIQKLTGWSPKYTLPEIVTNMLREENLAAAGLVDTYGDPQRLYR